MKVEFWVKGEWREVRTGAQMIADGVSDPCDLEGGCATCDWWEFVWVAEDGKEYTYGYIAREDGSIERHGVCTESVRVNRTGRGGCEYWEKKEQRSG